MRGSWRRWYRNWQRHGWWCPMHPWPPAWARGYWISFAPYYRVSMNPQEELAMLNAMKRDLDESLKELEARMNKLKDMITKEKTE